MAVADTKKYSVDQKGRLKTLKTLSKQIKDFDNIQPEIEPKQFVDIPKFIQDVALQTQAYILIFSGGIIFGFAIAHMISSMSH